MITEQSSGLPNRRLKAGAWYLAHGLRLLLYAASWLLCALIAALNAYLIYLLAAHKWVIQPLIGTSLFQRVSRPEELGVLLPSAVSVVIGCIAWHRSCRNNWGSPWTRFWIAFTVVSFLASALTGSRVFRLIPKPSWWQVMELVKAQLLLDQPPLNGIPAYDALALLCNQYAFNLLALIMLTGMVVYLLAQLCCFLCDGWRSSLDAAYGVALVQVGLWLLIVPPLGIIVFRALQPDTTSKVDFLFSAGFPLWCTCCSP